MKVGEWVAQAAARLQSAKIESARLEANLMAAHVLRVDRTWVVAHPGAALPELASEGLLQRRLRHEPLAYILGWRDFYSRRFSVRRGVLIPRHETEMLVDAALEIGPSAARVLDVGTGSGCIAISLALERKAWQVTACDISQAALDVAAENTAVLGASVKLALSDIGESLDTQAFDMIVSNPPYVARTDELNPEIRDYEPEGALYAENGGLAFYERLSKECGPLVSNDGQVVLELGRGQRPNVQHIFTEAGWTLVKTWRDLSGIDRVIAFRR